MARMCLGLAIAAFLVGGCSAGAPDGAPGAAGGPGTNASVGLGGTDVTSAPAPPTTLGAGSQGQTGLDPAHGPQFPLTLRRSGGIAGFDDRILLDADGRVRVETRSVHGRVCTLGASQRRQIMALLSTLPLQPFVPDLPSDPTTTDPNAVTESDPITISVTDDQSRAIDLSDPSLGEISGLVGTLVSDVTLSVPASTRCDTPPSTAAAASTP